MKSQFITPLLASQISESDWQLAAAFSYDSELLGRLVTVPVGFVTDFASVPRVPLAYWLVGGVGNKAAVIHDYLYRTCFLGADKRIDADKTFKEALGVLNIAAWRCEGMYLGVRAFGWKFYCGIQNPADSGAGNARHLGLPPPPHVKHSMIRSVQDSSVSKKLRAEMHSTVKELL